MKPHILIVDDNIAECRLFADALKSDGFDTDWTDSPLEALERVGARTYDAVVTDVKMPTLSGVELCRRLVDTVPNVPVVVVTAFGNIDVAVQAMRAGAYDFVTKPFDVDAIGIVLRRAVEHFALKREVDVLRKAVNTSGSDAKIVGSSHVMRGIVAMIDCLAPGDTSILITGESGTGKELVARELHDRSTRRAKPFLALNCAAVPESLLESELFGHVRGAFTDAHSARHGLLLAANGGTLLLDEIGDMPIALQPKLLRVLQQRTVRPVGGTHEVPFDVRILATTNRDLESAVEHGLFREDLYYRLNVINVEVPPLRARGGDILELATTFMIEIAARVGKVIKGFTQAAAERLIAYYWPGNVRELRNCVEHAVALTRDPMIDLAQIPAKIRDYQSRQLVIAGDDPAGFPTLEQVDRKYILRVLDACGGNKSRAAKVLGVGRKTLYRRLQGLGVDISDEEVGPAGESEPKGETRIERR